MDTLPCPHCHRRGIPSLWHVRPYPAGMRHLKTQHLCRLCGGVMFESGGGITLAGWVVIYMGICLFTTFLLIIYSNSAIVRNAIGVVNLGLIGFAAFHLVKRVVRLFR